MGGPMWDDIGLENEDTGHNDDVIAEGSASAPRNTKGKGGNDAAWDHLIRLNDNNVTNPFDKITAKIYQTVCNPEGGNITPSTCGEELELRVLRGYTRALAAREAQVVNKRLSDLNTDISKVGSKVTVLKGQTTSALSTIHGVANEGLAARATLNPMVLALIMGMAAETQNYPTDPNKAFEVLANDHLSIALLKDIATSLAAYAEVQGQYATLHAFLQERQNEQSKVKLEKQRNEAKLQATFQRIDAQLAQIEVDEHSRIIGEAPLSSTMPRTQPFEVIPPGTPNSVHTAQSQPATPQAHNPNFMFGF